jgi:hypothetical protein
MGTVHVMYGNDIPPNMPFRGFSMGGPGPAGDPFELLQLFMGGGGPLGAGPGMPFGGFGTDYDQEQMDRIITQVGWQPSRGSRGCGGCMAQFSCSCTKYLVGGQRASWGAAFLPAAQRRL